MNELQVNLYEVFMPSDLELLVRTKPNKLLDGELLLGKFDDTLSVIAQSRVEVNDASTRIFPTNELNPFLVQRLLVEGLSTSFSERSLNVEREKLSTNVFDPKDKVKVEYDFIELVRGVSFRAEHLTIQGRSHYAFYSSMRVRRRFTDKADRAILLNAAIGEEVRIHLHERSERVKLIKVGDTHVEVETSDFEVKEVAKGEVQVGASPSMLARYTHAIGQTDAHSRILVSSQVASYRYNASGAKVRSWLKAEFNFVGSWLARMSQGGRLPFVVPNSSSECYLGIKASAARGRNL